MSYTVLCMKIASWVRAKRFHNIWVPLFGCEVKRGAAPIVPRHIHIAASTQKDLGCLQVTILRGEVNRRFPFLHAPLAPARSRGPHLVEQVHVSAVLDEKVNQPGVLGVAPLAVLVDVTYP